MNQPSVYSRIGIIDAAYELIREKGWAAVSTRSVARKLGSSTMPIYSHVKSVDELERDLREKARRHLIEFQQRSYTDESLLNLALGYVVFARDEKHVFRFLFVDRPESLGSEEMGGMRDLFLSQFGAEGPEGAALSAFPPQQQEALIRYTWIFTHGLAMLVNSGALGSMPDEAIVRFLRDAGAAFYGWADRA